MGGNVVRGSGVFGSDAISLSNINTLGVKDGVIKMTVQVTDDQDRLIATTTTEYTKDTVLPKAYYLQTNLENYGTSNLDALVVKVVVESEDVNGSYKLAFAQNSTTAKLLGAKGSTAVPSDVVMEGLLDQTEIQLSNIDLSTLKDGIISSTLIVTDPNGNVGEPIVTYYNKLDGKLSLIKTITAVNDVIEVNEGGVASVLKNGSTTLLGNDYDSNSVLNAKIVSNPTHGTLALNANGTFSYTHDGSETTGDSFTYVANNGIADSNVATVSISITAVNDAPVAIAEAIKVMQGSTITTLVGGENSVLSNDTDAENNSLTAIVVTNPVNGTLTLNANGSFNYHHNGSATTSDSFSYKANDGNTNSNIVTVAITIEPFVLSYNNFSIETKSETCTGMKNGEVIINANQSQNYIAHINGKNYSFVNNSVSIPGMAPGNYPLCITIDGIAFEQCYNITIAGGGSLTGKSSISDNKLNVDITEGTAPFMVFVNGQSQFETIETNFSVSVKQGDLLEVKSAKACEGVYSKTAEDMFEMYSYPNPTNGIFEVAVTTSKQLLYLELFASNGILISKGNYNVENQKVRLSIEDQTAGVYLVKVYTDSPKTITVIKN